MGDVSTTFSMKHPAGARGIDEGPELVGTADLRAGSVEVTAPSSSRSTIAADGSAVWVCGNLFGSHSSPDDLLARFAHGGVDTLGSLEGLAVIVVWDGANRALHLVRHPGGAKMIYYRVDGDVVSFATRMIDLVRAGDRINWDAAAQFLRSGAILGALTMVNEIQRVPSHEAVFIAAGSRETRLVWTPRLGPRNQSPSTPERVEAIDELVTDAITPWLSSAAGDPAILMSGGIDSVGLAAAMLRIEPDLPLTAYTLRFEGPVGEIDEFDEAGAVATALGIRHEPIDFTPEFLVDHLDWMVTAYGGPIGYAIHTSRLSPIVEGGHSWVFAGTGPDAYYPENSQNRWESTSKVIPDRFHGSIARIAKSLGDLKGARGARKAFEIKSTPVAERLAVTVGPATYPEQLAQLGLSTEQVDRAVNFAADHFRPRLERLGTDDRTIQFAYGWSYGIFSDQGAGWMAKWTSAYQLGVAMPLHDPAIAEYLMRMSRLMTDRGEFRELALKSLPRSLAYNRKIGQSVPLALWLRGPLRELARERLLDTQNLDGFIDRQGVEELLAEHMTGAANHQWLIWKLITLSAWLGVFEQRSRSLLSH